MIELVEAERQDLVSLQLNCFVMISSLLQVMLDVY